MNAILINRSAFERALANAGPMTEQQRKAMFARRQGLASKPRPPAIPTRPSSSAPSSSRPPLTHPAAHRPVPLGMKAPAGGVPLAPQLTSSHPGGGQVAYDANGNVLSFTPSGKAVSTPGSRRDRPPSMFSPGGQLVPRPDRGIGVPGWYVPGGGGGPGLMGGVAKALKSAGK